MMNAAQILRGMGSTPLTFCLVKVLTEANLRKRKALARLFCSNHLIAVQMISHATLSIIMGKEDLAANKLAQLEIKGPISQV
jgi:hypothetical protein